MERLLDSAFDRGLAPDNERNAFPSGAGLPLGERLRYGAEAAVFFAFMALFRVIGLPAASRLGGWIGRNIFCWLPPDRSRAPILRAPFPEKTQAERNAIRRTMWDNLGRVVGEYPHLDKFTPKGEDPRITYSLPPGVTLDALKGQPADVSVGASGQLGDVADPGAAGGLISPRWCGRPTIPLSRTGWRASAASTGPTT